MKKVISSISLLFVGSILITSCSSESSTLSQFSKRKYMKRFKKERVKEENNLAVKENIEKTTKDNVLFSSVAKEEVVKDEFIASEVEVKQKKTIELNKNVYTKNYGEWNKYNRSVGFSSEQKKEIKKILKNTDNKNSQQVHDAVLIILGILLPPLAVYLYEDAITTNFWLDLVFTLIFWLPGVVFAFLVMYGGVSL